MNRFGYEIKDESEFVALKAVAIYNDYSYSFEEWFWSDLQRLGYILLYFNKENKKIYSNVAIDEEYSTLSFNGCVKEFSIPATPVLRIGDYEVEFHPDGIAVGCQFVSKEIIQKIANHFNKGE